MLSLTKQKMEESKKCTQCKRTLLLEQFRMNKRTGQVTKQCIKCLDIAKKNKEKYKCKHQKRKNVCFECGGVSLCEHKIEKRKCKDCAGADVCVHQRYKYTCKECKGVGICEHNHIKYSCKECRGGSICEHNRVRSRCKACGGGSICEHQKQKSTCKECKGGGRCQHERIRSICKDCKGGSICQHDKERKRCEECNPIGYIANIVRCRTYDALKHNKEMHSVEYLGCTIEELRQHIEGQFTEGMSWDNYGKWHIDHKIPIKYKQDGISPTIEEVAKRLHYTNTQPLWASDNISKGNRYIS